MILIKSKKGILATAVILAILIVISVLWYLLFSYIMNRNTDEEIKERISGLSSIVPWDNLNILINTKINCNNDYYSFYIAPLYCDYINLDSFNTNDFKILGIFLYKLNGRTYEQEKFFGSQGHSTPNVLQRLFNDIKPNKITITSNGIVSDLNNDKLDYLYEFDFVDYENNYYQTKIIIEKND